MTIDATKLAIGLLTALNLGQCGGFAFKVGDQTVELALARGQVEDCGLQAAKIANLVAEQGAR